MRVHVADHQLISHKLTYLRDKRTDSPTFRRLAEELVTLLAYEATREVRTLVIGAWDPKAGACGSVWDLVRDTRANHWVEVVGALDEEGCGEVLRAFFRERRA